MNRFDDRDPRETRTDWLGARDDARYPGDEFGGTYGHRRRFRDERDFGGSAHGDTPREAGGRDYGPGDDFSGGGWSGGRGYPERQPGEHPGHRQFGGRHAYEGRGQHPGHRDFGRHDENQDGARRWTASGYPGGFHGVGPRGYARSDERIREDVCERLAEHDAIDASGIDVRVEGGVAYLSGEVPERYMKHLAENTVADASGVTDVENGLRVRRSDTGSGSGIMGDPSLG